MSPIDDFDETQKRNVFDLLMRIGKYEEAEDFVRDLIGVSPNESRYYNWLGRIFYRRKEFDKAENAFRNSILRDPTNPYPFYNLGKIFLKKGLKEDARTALLRAVIYDPNNKDFIAEFARACSGSLSTKRVRSFLAFRVLVAKYIAAKRKKDIKSLEEIEKRIQKLGESADPYVSQKAYMGHIIVTGHWSAESQLLRHFKEYIKNPVLNIGCGTGEQSLIAALLLDELPSFSSEIELVFDLSTLLSFSFSDFGLLDSAAVFDQPRLNCKVISEDKPNFTIISIDNDKKTLKYAGSIITELNKSQKWLKFKFVRFDITKTNAVIKPKFNTAFACYLFHWLRDGLPAAVHNIASALKPGGHLVVLGECPIEYVRSPFLDYASSIHGKPNDVSLQEIVALCAKEGLRFVEEKEVEILTIDPKDRHPMFGVVFRKE